MPPGLVRGGKAGKPRRWRGHHKRVVLKGLIGLGTSAPGLIARARFYRPVRFYLLKFRQARAARVDLSANAVLLGPAFFRRGPRARMVLLAHELAHLADHGFRYSASKEFAVLAAPRIAKARFAHKRRKLTWYEATRRGHLRSARRAGLPNAYAAFSRYEAFGEIAAEIAAGRWTGDKALRGYILPILREPPGKADPAARLWHDAQAQLASHGDRVHVLRLLARTARANPQAVEARLTRLRLGVGLIGDIEFDAELARVVEEGHAPFLAARAFEIKALALLARGRDDGALRAVDAAIARLPGEGRLYVLRAQAHLAQRAARAALKDLRHARRLGQAGLAKPIRLARRLARDRRRQARGAPRK